MCMQSGDTPPFPVLCQVENIYHIIKTNYSEQIKKLTYQFHTSADFSALLIYILILLYIHTNIHTHQLVVYHNI